MTHTHILIGTLFSLAAGIFSAGCGGSQQEEQHSDDHTEQEGAHLIQLTPEAIKDIGLTTIPVEETRVRGSFTVPARLIPNQDAEAYVGSLVQGRVRMVYVNVGDVVHEGQTLMSIEGLEIGEITANFIKARAGLKYAEANFQRLKALFEENIGSRKSYLEARAEYDKALATFTAEDKRIHSIGLSDNDIVTLSSSDSAGAGDHTSGVLPIRAPISGTVIERNVVKGQPVDPSTTAFRVVNTASLWADGQMQESDARKLAGKPDAVLTVVAYPNESFRGKVIYVAPVVDERTRTIAVRAVIPNPHGRLKPHMFGDLRIAVGSEEKGLYLASESVVKDGAESYVFVAVTDTTFERRSVSTGLTNNDMVEVIRGVKPGEQVVVKGSFQLKSELMKETLGEDH